MTEVNTFSMTDIKNNMSLESLFQYKKDFYAHKPVRKALGEDYNITTETDTKVKGVSAWIQGLTQDTIDNLKGESDGLMQYFVGTAHFEQGEYKEAATAFGKATSANGPQEAIYNLVECLSFSGQFEEAEAKIATLPQDNANTLYCQGLQKECQLQNEEAIDLYLKAIEKDPHHRYALFRVAEVYNRFGNDDEAVKYYEKCREELPVILSCLINLGLLYEDNLKLQEAVYCFEEILETDANNAYAKLYLNDVNQSFNMQYDEESERLFDHQNRILKMKIQDFELSVRSRNCLERMNLYTIGDLVQKTEAELLSYPNFGETSLQEIKEILSSKGIQLGQKMGSPFVNQGFGGRPGKDQVDPKLKTSIATLKLSVRSTKVLETLGVANLGQLVQFTEDQLMAQKNFGTTSIREIKSKLLEYGLELSPKKSKRQTEEDSILASLKPQPKPAPSAPAPGLMGMPSAPTPPSPAPSVIPGTPATTIGDAIPATPAPMAPPEESSYTDSPITTIGEVKPMAPVTPETPVTPAPLALAPEEPTAPEAPAAEENTEGGEPA